MLTYVEDYIEFLYGSLDKDGGNNVISYRNINVNSTIKLATYDKSPVASMGAFCAKARTEKFEAALTDKQVSLARKIIFKYRRQLQNIGISLPESELDIPLRHTIRAIDRTKYLEYDSSNKQVYLKFPYDPKKISSLHDYVNTSAGKAEWNNTDRKWIFDLTEGNISKILDLFKNEDLKIDEELEPIIVDMFKATIKDLPSLNISNNTLQITNAHPKVFEYLETIDWDPSNLSKIAAWVSQAISLGLRIDEGVIDYLHTLYTDQVVNILVNRKAVLPSNNQPYGEWYTSLLEANQLLQDYPWVLHLTWWTNKTDWSPFKNMIEYQEKDKNSFRVQKQFAELLQGLKDPIVVVDSVIGRDAVRNFIENNSLKVVYISDIGQP